jgi:hypothetical protein
LSRTSKAEQVRAAETASAAALTAMMPPTRPLTAAQEMLLAFLRAHDAECPVCGYNVRGLTRPVCPECRQDLVLTVGAVPLRLGWLFVAVAPGFFSLIAACFVMVPLFGRMLFGDGRLSPALLVLDLFGWCSGIFAIILAIRLRARTRFIAMPRARQRWFALIIWLIHISVFVLFVLFARYFV